MKQFFSKVSFIFCFSLMLNFCHFKTSEAQKFKYFEGEIKL